MTDLEKVIYPFVYPELRGKDWEMLTGWPTYNVAFVGAQPWCVLPVLYIHGKYNANFLMHEIEPRLAKQGVTVHYRGIDCHTVHPKEGQWCLINQDGCVGLGSDPMKAVGEYLGVN